MKLFFNGYIINVEGAEGVTSAVWIGPLVPFRRVEIWQAYAVGV